MLQNIYNNLFPPTCVLCDAYSGTGSDLCQPCFLTLPFNHMCCRTCALPVPQDEHYPRVRQCGGCLANKSPIDATFAPFLYEAPSDFIVHQLKFHGSQKFGRLMGELLANAVKDTPRPDFLLPVPQHRTRLRDRGFNHACLIARTISKCISVPVCEDLASKHDARPPQSSLSAKARRQNMQNAFRIHSLLEGQHVAIIDDVITTGATSEALAGALIKAGCLEVSVWAFARTAQGSAG